MMKFSPRRKLDGQIREQALLELCQAMVTIKKLPEAAKVLGDLFSEQELEMIAKRLQIGKSLINGKTYDEIKEEWKVSDQTIARVNLWLSQAGDGLRMIMSRGLAKSHMNVPKHAPAVHRGEMARRFPLYYWPRGLLEGIIRAANNQQREQMIEALHTIRQSGKGKREVFHYIENLLTENRKMRSGSGKSYGRASKI